jgi:predicted ATPase
MIESVQFRNFRVLRDTILPLSRFTLLLGPNGSGKSTALQALEAVQKRLSGSGGWARIEQVITTGVAMSEATEVEVLLRWSAPCAGVITRIFWSQSIPESTVKHVNFEGEGPSPQNAGLLSAMLAKIRVYSLDATRIANRVQLEPSIELSREGAYLAGVLDRLRDDAPERFKALNEEWGRWLPEFDQILFDTVGSGVRAFRLRTRQGHYAMPASDLSQGTLLALAILTLAYLPNPPAMVCFEEPDRGIHPRLLRDVQDALYRLSYPESFGETRPPVQVLATTHSPYFLDLYRDHPEEVVIASRIGQEARFERLSDRRDLEEILGDASLSEVWYSGILGGVPVEP